MLTDVYIDLDLLFEPTDEGAFSCALNPTLANYLTTLVRTTSKLNFHIICKDTHIDSTKPNTLCLQHKEHNTMHILSDQAFSSILKQSNPTLFTEKTHFHFMPANQIFNIKDNDSAVVITNDQTIKDAAPCDIVSTKKSTEASRPFPQKATPKPFELNEIELATAKTVAHNTAETIKIEQSLEEAESRNAATVKAPRRKLIYAFDIDNTMIDERKTSSKRIPILNNNLVNKVAESIRALIADGIDVSDPNQVEFIVLSARLHDNYYNGYLFIKLASIIPLFIAGIKNATGVEIKFSKAYCLRAQDLVLLTEKRNDGTSATATKRGLLFIDPSTASPEITENMLKSAADLFHKKTSIPGISFTEITHIPLNSSENKAQNKALLAEHLLFPLGTARGEKLTLIHFDDDEYQLTALKNLGERLIAENSEHRLLTVSIYSESTTTTTSIPLPLTKINRHHIFYNTSHPVLETTPQPKNLGLK